jgi:hypothetical protein
MISNFDQFKHLAKNSEFTNNKELAREGCENWREEQVEYNRP